MRPGFLPLAAAPALPLALAAQPGPTAAASRAPGLPGVAFTRGGLRLDGALVAKYVRYLRL